LGGRKVVSCIKETERLAGPIYVCWPETVIANAPGDKYMDKQHDRQITKDPIVWTGDLNDDCTALWNGLMLRAEWMDEDYWWWRVYDMQNENATNEEATIDDSNNYDTSFIGGDAARKKAEEVAKKYLGLD
jgi:hypothetical protein